MSLLSSPACLVEAAAPLAPFVCSALEAVRDLAVVAALLKSAEQGGTRVPVQQF